MHLGEPVGSDLEDPLGIVLGLQRARSLDEEAREAPVVETCAGRRRRIGVISIGARSVSPRSRKTRTSRRWNHATGTTSSGGLGAARRRRPAGRARCGPTPYWTPTSATADGGCLAVDAASDDPPAQAGDEHDRGREIRSGDLVLAQAGPAQRRVEEDEVGSQVGDQPRVERREDDAVDREQESEVAKLAEPRQSHARRGRRRSRCGRSRQARRDSRPMASCRGGDGEVGRGEHLVRAAARAALPVRCAGRAPAPRRSPRRAATPAGRGSASYPRSTPSMRSITGCSATPGRCASAARSDDALPITAAFKLPLDSFSDRHASPVVHVTPSHRASNKTVSSGTVRVQRRDLQPGISAPPGGAGRRPFR